MDGNQEDLNLSSLAHTHARIRIYLTRKTEKDTMSASKMSAAPAAAALAAPASVGDGMLTPESLVDLLRSCTEEQLAEIVSQLNRGAVRVGEAVPAKTAKKTVGRPKKAATAPPPLPEADGEEAPGAEAYRLAEEDIDHSICVGRSLAGGEDKRWKPAVYREKQCGGEKVEGSDLCATCIRRLEKYAATPKPGPWTGRVTEDPEPWVHMLGTTWADEKSPKWLGEAGAARTASDSSSDSGASEQMSAADAKLLKAQEKAKKEEEKAQKAKEKAEALAKKAEEKAAKDAEKAKKAEEKKAKEVEKAKKAEEKAKKDAEKAAKAAAPKAAPAKKANGGAGKEEKPAVEAKAASAAAPAEVEGELKLIDGTLYMVKSGNVYEYDELTEKAGDFVGRLTADETIDTDAEELSIEEDEE